MYIKIETKDKLINHDCLPILMLLYIMLAYLMLFAALSNAFVLFFAIDFCKCFCFHAWSSFIDTKAVGLSRRRSTD